MSWNDVIIGTGEAVGSAVKVFDCPGLETVSENRVSYWVHDAYLGIGMTIFKNTEEGESLAFMLKNGSSARVITEFLEDLVMKNVSPRRLREHVETALNKAYRKGGDDRASDIRKALGIVSDHWHA